MTSLEKIHVVAGATATGKTDYAIQLAKEIDGEIINADSMQVYRYMDIGTNKGEITELKYSEIQVPCHSLVAGNPDIKLSGSPTKSGMTKVISQFEIEQSGIFGWLFDVVNPDEEFSVALYVELAREVIKNIQSRGKVAIVVGGTGLYIDALLKGYDLDYATPNDELRSLLNKLSVEELQERLKSINQNSFEKLNESDSKNPRRLIRLIEKLTEDKGESDTIENGAVIESEIHYIEIPREELNEKINSRADEMFKEGFVQEVRDLIEMGYKHTAPMKGLGYKEVVSYLDDEMTFAECVEKTKQSHRNYAKRQVTWFKKYLVPHSQESGNLTNNLNN